MSRSLAPAVLVGTLASLIGALLGTAVAAARGRSLREALPVGFACGYSVFVVVVLLMPAHSSIPQSRLDRFVSLDTTWREAALNVLLVVPLGMVVGLSRRAAGLRFALVVPFLAEGVQILVPGLQRRGTATDLMAYSVGLACGIVSVRRLVR